MPLCKQALENLLTGKVRLNRRHKYIIKQVPSQGDRAYIDPSKVELKDLEALTAATKDEFALFAGSGEAIIVHGGIRWNLPTSAWEEIQRKRLEWVGHSHPTTVDLRPSDEDRETLRKYFMWQEKSAIIDLTGKVKEFTGNLADAIDKLLGVK